MIDVSVKEGLEQVIKSLKNVDKNVPKAFSAALNRTAEGVRTEGVRAMKKTYNIKYSGLRNEIRITKANPKKLTAILQASGRNLPLIQFKTSPGKPPGKQPKVLKATVKKGGYKTIPGAFVANLGKFQPGVFIRTGPGHRAPVKELFGPGVPVMMGEHGVVEHMSAEAERRMAARLDHEITRILGRMK